MLARVCACIFQQSQKTRIWPARTCSLLDNRYPGSSSAHVVENGMPGGTISVFSQLLSQKQGEVEPCLAHDKTRCSKRIFAKFEEKFVNWACDSCAAGRGPQGRQAVPVRAKLSAGIVATRQYRDGCRSACSSLPLYIKIVVQANSGN